MILNIKDMKTDFEIYLFHQMDIYMYSRQGVIVLSHPTSCSDEPWCVLLCGSVCLGWYESCQSNSGADQTTALRPPEKVSQFASKQTLMRFVCGATTKQTSQINTVW